MVTVGSSFGTRPPDAFLVTPPRYVHGRACCAVLRRARRGGPPPCSFQYAGGAAAGRLKTTTFDMKALTRAGLVVSINVSVFMLSNGMRTRYDVYLIGHSARG